MGCSPHPLVFVAALSRSRVLPVGTQVPIWRAPVRIALRPPGTPTVGETTEKGGRKHEGGHLAGREKRAGRRGPRSEDRAADRRDHQGHLDRALRLGPAPLRGARDVHRPRRRARPRADGRRRGGRRRGRPDLEGRPGRDPVQHLLRPLLDVRAPAVRPVRDDPEPRHGHGRLAVRLHEALRPGARRPGRVPAGPAGPLRPDQGARNGAPDDRFLFLSDVLPTAWQAVEFADDPGGRLGGDLRPRADRPDGGADRQAQGRAA